MSTVDYSSLARGMKGVDVKRVAVNGRQTGYNVPGIGFVPGDVIVPEYALAKRTLASNIACLPGDVEKLGNAVKEIESSGLRNTTFASDMRSIQRELAAVAKDLRQQ